MRLVQGFPIYVKLFSFLQMQDSRGMNDGCQVPSSAAPRDLTPLLLLLRGSGDPTPQTPEGVREARGPQPH